MIKMNLNKNDWPSTSHNFRDLEIVFLTFVVPVFNESESVDLFISKVNSVFNQHTNIKLEVVFINDGSVDETLDFLLRIQNKFKNIKIIDFSRNFGKEAALTAGLRMAKGHIVVPIDVDLQDPPELVLEMISLWKEGYEVVLGRRINRASDLWLKKVSALLFYRIYNKISTVKIPENVGDFRLLDRCVVDALLDLPESCRFMKGLFSWVGFKTAYVDYTRPIRAAGSSKYNGWKLWNFALEGITSFSTDPLRIWTYLGSIVSLVSFLFAIYIAIRVMLHGIEVPGYASVFTAVTFLGGLQLIGIGVIGEYLGRTYLESKRRPVYLVRQIYEIKL
jgi:glycosyltransferase involved in cell wall biosynthesis